MQRTILFFAVLALTVACALAQTKPKLPSTFETHGIVQISHNNSVVFGEGTHSTHTHPSLVLSLLSPRRVVCL
jgi:hypothetical protein